MSGQMDDVFQECVNPLRPYLGQLVIAGGWVPYLYTKLYDEPVASEPLFTSDFDVALARQGLLEEERTLDGSILESGFRHEFASLDKPPVVKYVKSLEGNRQVEIEFITELARTGKAVEEVGSVNAQALRDVGLLLDKPWEYPLRKLGLAADGMLRLPRPAMFVAHKVLVAPRRRQRQKIAKDLYYAFYVLDSFPLWRDQALSEIGAFAEEDQKRARVLTSYIDAQFADIDSEGMTLIASQRPQTAYRLMSEDQFRRYALNRMRELRKALGD